MTRIDDRLIERCKGMCEAMRQRREREEWARRARARDRAERWMLFAAGLLGLTATAMVAWSLMVGR